MFELISTPGLGVLLQIIMIDLVLAGDNAIVIGLAAAGLPPEQRSRVILFGIAAATLLRIAFAAVTTQLLQIVGLLFAGGILLLWVCWKMWREMQRTHPRASSHGQLAVGTHGRGMVALNGPPQKTLAQAAWQIILADVSMSLDNVLAVAGAAKGHTTILVIGLAVAVVLMAVAATFIAKLLARFPWITWLGLAIVFYVAIDMMWRGSLEVVCAYVPEAVCRQGLVASMAALVGQ
jgi:YjbE family integral membrane protein